MTAALVIGSRRDRSAHTRDLRIIPGRRSSDAMSMRRRAVEDDDEAGTMVRIDPESQAGVHGASEAFGPLAFLLVGFLKEDVDRFMLLMQQMEADGELKVTIRDMLEGSLALTPTQVVPCTRAMLKGSLKDALEVKSVPQFEAAPLGVRRTLFMSGLFGSEVIQIVSGYNEAGLPSCVFAAAVPNNYMRRVEDLVTEVQAENEAMVRARVGESFEKGSKSEDEPLAPHLLTAEKAVRVKRL